MPANKFLLFCADFLSLAQCVKSMIYYCLKNLPTFLVRLAVKILHSDTIERLRKHFLNSETVSSDSSLNCSLSFSTNATTQIRLSALTVSGKMARDVNHNLFSQED